MGGVLGIMLSNQTILSVTATGGNYIYDGTGSYVGYRFHVFTSPGTFTVTSNPTNKTFDAVIVGGGGGSGIASATADGGGGAGGGAITEVTGLSLTTNSGYAATVGPGGVAGPTPGNPSVTQSNSGSASSWNGYSASGGTRSTGPLAGASSGNGNPGGTLVQGAAHTGVRLGNGGGGAGGAGVPYRGWGPIGSPAPAYPAYVPYFTTYGYPTPYTTYYGTGIYTGGGGSGVTSSIDGVMYGGGGAGGVVVDSGGAVPSAYWNGKYTPETDPTGTGFNNGGGGLANSAGANGKGGGAGGQPGGPPAFNNQFVSGGSGTVVIRYALGVTLPGAPTGVTVAPNGTGQAIVSFTAPASNGGGSITSYTVVSTPGNITATGSTSPITITGLTDGTSYTFKVYATNSAGNGSLSGASSPYTPYPSVAASGGQLIYDLRGYRYHVFTSAGQPAPFQPTQFGAAGSFVVTSNPGNKLFDVMCVGGGGNGGASPAVKAGSGGGGGGAVADYFNIPITIPAPAPASLPVYVGQGLGLGVPISGSPVVVPQYVSRFGDYPLGYTAAAGIAGVAQSAGASGNGNSGGAAGNSNNNAGGSGGGGAGGIGSDGLFYPPSADGGSGGSGATSSIAQSDSPHGNIFGGGGGGGSGTWPLGGSGVYGAGGPGGGGDGGGTGHTAGPGGRGFAGTSNKGGGGGGQAAGTLSAGGSGGSGIVVVRYPYP